MGWAGNLAGIRGQELGWVVGDPLVCPLILPRTEQRGLEQRGSIVPRLSPAGPSAPGPEQLLGGQAPPPARFSRLSEFWSLPRCLSKLWPLPSEVISSAEPGLGKGPWTTRLGPHLMAEIWFSLDVSVVSPTRLFPPVEPGVPKPPTPFQSPVWQDTPPGPCRPPSGRMELSHTCGKTTLANQSTPSLGRGDVGGPAPRRRQPGGRAQGAGSAWHTLCSDRRADQAPDPVCSFVSPEVSVAKLPEPLARSLCCGGKGDAQMASDFWVSGARGLWPAAFVQEEGLLPSTRPPSTYLLNTSRMPGPTPGGEGSGGGPLLQCRPAAGSAPRENTTVAHRAVAAARHRPSGTNAYPLLGSYNHLKARRLH